ncbi:MAG: CPBP family intramembrane glutamic endopeptidase [Acidobacteriota bacterium]
MSVNISPALAAPATPQSLVFQAKREMGIEWPTAVIRACYLALAVVSAIALAQLTLATGTDSEPEALFALEGFLKYLPALFAISALSWAALAFFFARGYVNLNRLSMQKPGLSAGTLVLGLLVPGLNLVILGMATQELWQLGGAGDGRRFGGLDSEGHRSSDSWMPTLWWLATLFMTVALAWLVSMLLQLSPEASSTPEAVVLHTKIITAGVLWTLSTVAWALMGVITTGRLARKQLDGRIAMLGAGLNELKALGAPERDPDQMDPNLGAAAIGFAVLGWFTAQVALNAFLPAYAPLLSIFTAQLAFIAAGFAIASLRGVSLASMVRVGEWSAVTMLCGTVAGACLPFLTIPWAKDLLEYFGVEAVSRTLPVTESMPAVLLTIAVVFVAPIVEEVIFRGIVYESIENAFRSVVAIFGSAIIFGLIHANYVQSTITALIGILLGLARWRTGGIFVAVGIHLGNNLSVSMLADQPATLAELKPVAVMMLVVCLAILFTRPRQGLAALQAGAKGIGKAKDLGGVAKGWTQERLGPESQLRQDLPATAQRAAKAAVKVRWGPWLATAAAVVSLGRAGYYGFDFARRAPLGIESFVLAVFYGILAVVIIYGQRARAALGAMLLSITTIGGFRFDWWGAVVGWSTYLPTGRRPMAISAIETVFSLVLIGGCIAVALGHRGWSPYELQEMANEQLAKRDGGAEP